MSTCRYCGGTAFGMKCPDAPWMMWGGNPQANGPHCHLDDPGCVWCGGELNLGGAPQFNCRFSPTLYHQGVSEVD